MDKKHFFYFELVPGMVLADDVFTPGGQLVLRAGTRLTDVTINRLTNYSIMEVCIDLSPNPMVIDDSTVNSSPHSVPVILKTQRFKQFNKSYQHAKANLESHLNSIVEAGSQIDTDALLQDTFKHIDTSYHSFEIFDMIHNISYFDNSSYVHSMNVALIASLIGQWINLGPNEIKLLSLCGLLHDIGKLAIPEEILKKPGRLTDEEFEIMKTHTQKGYDILKDQDIDTAIKQTALLHHEKCDGSGYPFKLTGKQIPLFVKIVTIADIYDAMTAKRVYREPLSPFKVIQAFQNEGLHKYDPLLILTFLENVVMTYMNAEVRLSDGRVGKVVMLNKLNLARPMIRIDDEFIDLVEHPSIEIEEILSHSKTIT